MLNFITKAKMEPLYTQLALTQEESKPC